MKGVVFLGNRRCEVRDVPVPQPGHGEVLIQVKAAGICGSDLHVYRRTDATEQVRGHEACGEVVELGPGVLRVKVGDRVSVHHHQGCGACYQCARGETVACTVRHQIIGVDVSGALGEYVATQERNCIPLAATSSFVDGAFLACVGSTSYAALRRMGVSAHESVAVFGLGPVGLSCVLVARALGLRVAGIDVIPGRVALAQACGAQLGVDGRRDDAVSLVRKFGAIPGAERGEGVDYVVETSGSTAGRSAVLPCLRREGKGVFVGVASSEPVINPSDIHGRAATLLGSIVFPLAWMWDLARLCGISGLSFEPAVTHRFGLDDAVEALRVADGATGGKVIFEPSAR